MGDTMAIKKASKKAKTAVKTKASEKKTTAKTAVKKAKDTRKEIGLISHFYPNICVAVVEMKSKLKVGDKISIEGRNGALKQIAKSMQIDNEQIDCAKKGESIGLKTDRPVRAKDVVYLIE